MKSSSTFTLHMAGQPSHLPVSCLFIDRYMPSANGTFVKIYLCLLRCLMTSPEKLSISYFADLLDETEGDIRRGLSYWEKQGLLEIRRDESGEIAGITLREPGEDSAEHPPVPVPAREPSSASSPKQAADTEEIQSLLHVIEMYLERPLKPVDVQLVLYLCNELKFSADLIIYLYEYCVSRNKKNSSYVETVALAWHKEGITTVEQAARTTEIYNSNYQTVNKAFGLNRSPGKAEKQFISKWFTTFGFSQDMVTEACDRTILRTGKPDFKYADSILTKWHEAGITTKEELHAADSARLRTAPLLPKQEKKSSSGQFHAFPQRNYSSTDYSSMEQQLLKRE